MLYALAAYAAWGILPIYWKLLSHLPALEILAHRIVWASLFFVLLVRWKSSLRELVANRRYLPPLLVSGSLIGANWFTYIHAVNSNRVLETSLGYFLGPLMSVFLGRFALGEPLRRRQWVAVGLVGAGVLGFVIESRTLPGLGLILAATFALYGLIRKRIAAPPLAASTIETLVLAIPALAWLASFPSSSHSSMDWTLLVLSGVATGLPFLWFGLAAARLPLTTLGFLQYIAPALQFALAVWAYGEPFSAAHARVFAMIWVGLGVFVWDLCRQQASAE